MSPKMATTMRVLSLAVVLACVPASPLFAGEGEFGAEVGDIAGLGRIGL